MSEADSRARGAQAPRVTSLRGRGRVVPRRAVDGPGVSEENRAFFPVFEAWC